MKYLKSKDQYIKEEYFSELGDKLQSTKDDAVRGINQTISDKVSGTIPKAIVKTGAKMGGFPKAEMDKFINYVYDNCQGEVITVERIKELVAPMLHFGVGLSADRARGTAVPTDNIDFVALISELVYDEMGERNMLDLSSEGDLENDENFEDEENY